MPWIEDDAPRKATAKSSHLATKAGGELVLTT